MICYYLARMCNLVSMTNEEWQYLKCNGKVLEISSTLAKYLSISTNTIKNKEST